MPVEPISVIAAGLASTVKILEVSFQLKAVDEQTADLLRLTDHVNRNVQEARRLRALIAEPVSADGGGWMDAQIGDCEKALQEIQQLIEPARVNNAINHSINPKNRVLWVFKDGPRVRDKRERLSACHQTLTAVISALITMNSAGRCREVVVAAPLPTDNFSDPPPPYAKDLEDMFNWRNRGRNRKSFADTKSTDSCSIPASSFCDPSMSDLLTTVPQSSDAPISSPTEVQNPPVSCISEKMSAHAAPSSFYCSYDGQDGLEVFETSSYSCDGQDGLQVYDTSSYFCNGQDGLQIRDTSSCSFAGDDGLQVFNISKQSKQSQVARDLSSSALLPQVVDNLPYTMSSSYMTGPPNPSKFPEEPRRAHDQGYTPSPTLTTTAESSATVPRSFGRTRGQEWLACYAARSDVGLSYGNSQGYG